jgi:ATP-dependent Clp protease ATP-binding subunit ClpC
MFERYTEKARRAIFFGRYEASQFGSPYIETEHLLLALLREDPFTKRCLRPPASTESIRREIEARTTAREKASTSADLPLSHESKRALANAANEADQLNHKHIGAEHLLLGLLREEKCLAAEILHQQGVLLVEVREQLARLEHQPETALSHGQRESSAIVEFSRNLTQAALEDELDPLIGRDAQVDQILQILARRSNHNAVLVGPPGVGKKTIVAGLAQRIADGIIPQALASDLLVDLNLSSLVVSDLKKLSLKTIQDTLSQARAIFVIDELHTPASSSILHDLLKPLVMTHQIQCISLATPSGYDEAVKHHAWLQSSFQVIPVPPATEPETLAVLRGLKDRYEKFHGVTYTGEALTSAVHYAGKCLTGYLPGKAVGLIDEAGVSLNSQPLPEEVRAIQKKLRFIINRMQACIANHEFEKARFYSDEERIMREHLRIEQKKYGADPAVAKTITRDDIETTVSRMTGLSLATVQRMRPTDPEPQL